MDKDKHKIEEVNWVTSYNKPEQEQGFIGPHIPTYPTVASRAPQGTEQRAKFSGLLPDCARMYPFQKDIYHQLKNKDLYVAANPGAGKTLPYLCYWSSRVLDIDTLDIEDRRWKDYMKTIEILLINPEKIPKLVILTPTRQLADQVFAEFKKHFAAILANILDALLQKLTTHPTQHPTQEPNQMLNNDLLRVIHGELPRLADGRMNRYYVYVKAVNDRDPVGRIEQLKREIEQTDKLIEHYGIEGIKRITDSKSLKAGKSLIAKRHGNESIGDIDSAPVIVGIYESMEKYMSKIKDNIALIVCDESHLIEDKEIRNDSRATNISYALYSILKTVSNKTKLCFLSGTENPDSAQNFANYLKVCYNRNVSVIEPPSTAGNQSQITVHADDSIVSERSLLNIITNPRIHHTVIVIFSKKKIDKLAQAALQKSGRTPLHNLSSGFKFTDTARKSEFSLYKRPSSNSRINKERMAREAGRTSGASHIHNRNVREYVQAGFGVIYRVDDRDPDRVKRGKDNQIVAELFSKGKIRVLLSTDAIGVGVNIDVKTMYIPTIEKFHGGSIKEMDPPELSQLINRTGRGAFMYSNVVTTSKYVAPITNALSLAPRQFSKGVTIEKIPKELCATANGFKFLWKNQLSMDIIRK